MDPRAIVLHHPSCLDHAPPAGHPEAPVRLRSALAALEPALPGVAVRASKTRVGREALLRVHSADWIDRLLALNGRTAALDAETFVSAGSVEAALSSASMAIELVDEVLAGPARRGFALTRPPGHHALPDRPMGYCLLNNAALAAAHAIARGLSRILVIDWDVHHGNGTQRAFFDRSDVLFFDLHQEELFPPGGGIDEIGEGEGLGYTVNVPLPSGCTDSEYLWIAERLLPALGASYQPELVLVSAGFDAFAGDPEGGMELSAGGFAALTAIAVEIADRFAEGRLVMVLEGGYLPAAVGESVRAVASVLGGGSPPAIEPHASPLVRAAAHRVEEAQIKARPRRKE